ncbi:DUF4383 domain-containing protein [Saccharopolyspora erythraea]|uniref:DUF4383 domain-containing protein n=1 Tax=Saccharopolyspora erythraea TaxID=1836 RepID=UPI001BA48850|nr:DUF4383 domain-containing protein [Saccharopolyspora erythraea]QUH01272.1 DUF4383 domain-containing protein [Saccharopolyspora erythraea]
MRMDRYLPPDHPLSKIYRIGAAIFGAGLLAFGVLGLANQLPFLSTEGAVLLGLSSNGLLSVISILVGAILIGAAVWGGAIASTTTTVIGVLFFVSGLANLAVMETPFNLLAFRWPNVIFSLVAGMLLTFLGTYGRIAGRLPEDNPYYRYRHHEPPPDEEPVEEVTNEVPSASDDELTEAEMAFAEGHPTPKQERMVRADAWRHQQEERRRAYQHYAESGRTPDQEISAQNLWADFPSEGKPTAPGEGESAPDVGAPGEGAPADSTPPRTRPGVGTHRRTGIAREP